MCDNATMKHDKDLNFGTKLVHVGHNPNEWTYKDVVPPISMSTIFNTVMPGVNEVRIGKGC